MRIAITARNTELTPALRDYVEKKLERIKKYLNEPIDVKVVVMVEKFRQLAEFNVSAPGVNLNAEEESQDLYASIDVAVDKLEEQARRHKEKTQQKARDEERAWVKMEVLDSETEDDSGPKIIRTKRFAMKPMSIEEAAMQLDISDSSFLVFLNPATERVNVIYRRKDGNFGLIEPEF